MTLNMPTKRALIGLSLAALCLLFSGCAATLALLALDKWFKDSDPAEYRVFLDGYDVGTAPSASGYVLLRGASEGDYLLTVAKSPDLRYGVHATVHLTPGRYFSLADLNPFEGGVINGTVRRDTTLGPLLGNVRVVAIKGAADLLAGGSGPLAIPQPAGTTVEYMMGYTDATGAFRLGPAKYGDWLVTAVTAGHAADVQHVHLAGGVDGYASLVLTADAAATSGIAQGTVTSRVGTALGSALITGKLGTPFSPTIEAATRSRVAAAAGVTLPPGPWFEWRTLTTIAAATGQYILDLPVGAHNLEAYKFQWRATESPVTITEGGSATVDFSLFGA